MNFFISARRLGFFLAVLVWLLPAKTTFADTNTITLISDFSPETSQETLTDAIAQGGRILFSTNGAITLTSTIRITNDVIFDGKITNIVIGTSNIVTITTNGAVTNQVFHTNAVIDGGITNFVLGTSNIVTITTNGAVTNQVSVTNVVVNGGVTNVVVTTNDIVTITTDSVTNQVSVTNAVVEGGITNFVVITNDVVSIMTNSVTNQVSVTNVVVDGGNTNFVVVTTTTVTAATTNSVTNQVSVTNIVVDGGITNFVVITNTTITAATTNSMTNTVPFTNVDIPRLTNMVKLIGPASNGFRLFEIASNATVGFDHIQFVNGGGSLGGAISNGGRLALIADFFSDNHARGRNGHNGGSPGAGGTDGANAYGGAIFNASTSVVINCYFQANTALGGNGGDGENGAADSLFGGSGGRGGNGGAGLGGAIYNKRILLLAENTFAKNLVSGGDAGFAGIGGSAPFPGVSGDAGSGGNGFGGAIYNTDVETNVASLFVENRASGGSATVQFSLKNGPSGGSAGGGALFNSKTLVMADCTITSNTCSAGVGGGAQSGIFIFGGRGGSASGGGIYNVGRAALTNCTFAYGAVTNGLGGVSLNPDGNHNGAPGLSRGGNLFSSLGSMKLLNCIVAYGFPANTFGTLSDQGHNLSSDRSSGFTATGSLNNSDPKLELLANNGGFTFTMALGNGSPAIDRGSNLGPKLDQRGTNRVDGKFDIGAFELIGPFTVNGSVLYGTNSPVINVVLEVDGTNLLSQVATNFFVTNDIEGGFSFVVDKGTYTITPSAPGTNTFKAVTTNIISSIDNLRFSTSTDPMVVKGRVANLAGTGMIGVKLLSTNALGNSNSVLSGINGIYKFAGIAPVESTITPVSSNAIFIPASRTVDHGSSNINFLRIPTFTVSGVITGKTASIVVSNLSVLLSTNGNTSTLDSALTDRHGKFIFSNVIQGTYLVQPQAGDLIFSPTNKPIHAVSNITNLKFFATNSVSAQ